MRLFLGKNADVITPALMEEVAGRYLNCNYLRKLIREEIDRFLDENNDDIIVLREK